MNVSLLFFYFGLNYTNFFKLLSYLFYILFLVSCFLFLACLVFLFRLHLYQSNRHCSRSQSGFKNYSLPLFCRYPLNKSRTKTAQCLPRNKEYFSGKRIFFGNNESLVRSVVRSVIN